MSEKGGNMDNNTRWQEFNSIIDNEYLDHKEKSILLIIFRFSDNKSDFKWSYPSRNTLKKLYGTKRDETLDNILNSLYEKNILIKRTGKGNRNEYQINYNSLNNEISPKSVDTPKTVDTPINGETVPTENGGTVPPKNGAEKEKKNKIKENIYSDFDSYTENEELKTTLKDFAEMRKAIKKPLTTKRAIKMLINKLDVLASTDEEKKLILEQSIFNNWQGVFELKDKKQILGQFKIENIF